MHYLEDFDEFDDSVEETTPLANDMKRLLEDMTRLAKYYITMFFSGKSIPHHRLYDKENVSMVLNTGICEGMEKIYGILAKEKLTERGQLPADIQKVLNLLRQCARLGIPKNFMSGIIIMHLQFAKEYKFPV